MKAEPYGRFKPLPPEAVTLLQEGRVIDAVKSVRLSHNLGLRDAKDWIDAHIASEPLLRVQLETKQREARRKIFFAVLVIDALIAAGLIYYFFYRP
ncbi:MAG TPA: hypothetical protein VMF52_18265 [Steroidobacteraceae bacterium]|nr:hypothetical protein [Steroidobacteraceae bacterium]